MTIQLLTVNTIRFSRLNLSGIVVLASAVLSSCAYRLPVSNVPSQQRLMIVARSPERYVVRVQASDVAEFPVATDGRVTVDVPRLPRSCDVYLFDRIRISRGVKPLTAKSLHVIDSGNIAAKLSLAEIAKLPSDASGYHILKLKR